MTPLYVVTKRMPHHRDHAGYNRLLADVGADVVVWAPAGRVAKLAGAITRRLWRPLTGVQWYGAPSAFAELGLAARIRTRPPGVVHVMYGEDLLYALPRIAGPHRVVATFHQPPERFESVVRGEAWRRLDAVITLDDNNAEAWTERLGPARVHRATLGVDVDYWHPGERADRVLTVGNHLRDFDLLERTIRRCPSIGFDLVVPAERHARFAGLANARCFSDVSDDRLAELYRTAALLFLPLRGGSASNTLLQALASGLPIVTTDFAGGATYLDDACAVTVPSSDVGAAQALAQLLADDPRRQIMAAAARHRAESFAWSVVSERHRTIFSAVHQG